VDGFNFLKFSPTYFLIETTTDENRINTITSYMSDKNYEVIERLSGNDFLFKLKI